MSELEVLKSFIFKDDVQKVFSDINDNLMGFNILEITGMGTQEIKHSNILGWFFDNREHNLEYIVLDNFLKNIIIYNKDVKNQNDELTSLNEYIYLAENKKSLTIYREQDNIDVLIVDEVNKVVITIENKVYATERIDGNDGGQLKKYEDIVKNKYDDTWKKYYIFLTIDLEEPSQGDEYWFRANHQMITDVIEHILQTNNDLSVKTKIILESYVDLLKRNGIVEDKKLKELCEKIWNNKDYKSALEILFNNRPNKLTLIKNMLGKLRGDNFQSYEEKSSRDASGFYLSMKNESPYIYKIWYSVGQRKIYCRIVTRQKNNPEEYRKNVKNILELKEAKDCQYGYHNLTYNIKEFEYEEEDISDESITKLIEKFQEIDNKLYNNKSQ